MKRPNCPDCRRPMVCYKTREKYRCPECDIMLFYNWFGQKEVRRLEEAPNE